MVVVCVLLGMGEDENVNEDGMLWVVIEGFGM